MRSLLLVVLLAFPLSVLSKPVMVAEADGAKVTLTDEKCELSDVVSNLPYRGTWEEKGKTFEGCWGVNGFAVMTYWTDKTVAALPRQMFRPLTGV